MLLRGPALPASPVGGRQGLARSRLRDGGSAHPRPSPARGTLRAGRIELALANGPVYVYPQAAKPARLPGRVHGRSQPFHRRLRIARQSVVGPGDRSVAGGVERLWSARGDPDRQRLAVRDLARQERLHARVGETRRQADRGHAAAAADARQDRALLGHSVARVSGERGVRRSGRRPAADRSTSSTITTSNGRIRESRGWCRRTGSSERRRK